MNTIYLLDRAKASQIMWLGVLKSAVENQNDGAVRLAWRFYCKHTDIIDHLTGGTKPCAEIDHETWKTFLNQSHYRRYNPGQWLWSRKAVLRQLIEWGCPMHGYTNVAVEDGRVRITA
jgi:hypothetical protein